MGKRTTTIMAALGTVDAPDPIDFVVDGDHGYLQARLFTLLGTNRTVLFNANELRENGHTLAYDAQLAAFTVGRTVKGMRSGATGFIMNDTAAVAVAATSVLTFIANAEDADQIILGGVSYILQTSLVNAPNNVLIGAAATNTIDNLVAAIEAGAGAGTLYGTGTVANPDVDAAVGAGDTMDVTAVVAGAAGNNIIATTDFGIVPPFNATFTVGARLQGGLDATTLSLFKISGHFQDNEPIMEDAATTPGKAVANGLPVRAFTLGGDWINMGPINVSSAQPFKNPDVAVTGDDGELIIVPRRFRLSVERRGLWTSFSIGVQLMQSGGVI